ncbi:hypothetical protein ACVMB1_004199 [Bradyrhizobium sp. USDA 4504]
MQRRDVLHHMGRLRALIDREPCLGRIPIGNDGARFKCHAGVAPEYEVGLDEFGPRQCMIDVAGVERPLKGKIVAERSMNDGSCRIERSTHVRDRLELLVVD